MSILIKKSEMFYSIPQRFRTANKHTFGTILGVGGCRGMAGAVAMAGRAALLAGAGLVQLAVPDPVLETVAGFYPEITTIPCNADAFGRFSLSAFGVLQERCRNATNVFIGPGLGRSDELAQLVPQLLCSLQCPVVVDADALLRCDYSTLKTESQSREQKTFVLTPHSGEFARLREQETPSEEQIEERKNAAMDYAKRNKIVLVLKGHRTIITDGEQLELNTTGNPGMATGGSGDVLTGLLTGLLAQRLALSLKTPYETVCLGVYLHGLAGDIAAEKYGEQSVTATAILEAIPSAFAKITRK